MSVAKVLKLQEYRDRRHHRLSLHRAFNRMDPGRRQLLHHMAEMMAQCGADRVATVWVDEYGPGLIHPFAVLDLLSDAPRRGFAMEPLRRAWEIGVPGAHDEVAAPGETGPSTFAIALGSDGARAWFVVADSVLPRPPLDSFARDRLMFLAGECSAVALHRDLDTAPRSKGEEGRFAGWPVLKDLEGLDEGEPESHRIAQRFIGARVVRMFVDDDLAMPEEQIAQLAEGARREMREGGALDSEEQARWERMLAAFERQDFRGTASVLVELAEAAEDRGHPHGAAELYRCAYALAVADGSAEDAADAARFLGRLHRRRAERDDATLWYETAYAIASAARMDHIAALCLSGIGSTRKELGNIPGAREIMVEGLALAERSGDAQTISTLHRALATVEISAGDAEAALRHGWEAVGISANERERTRCLATLAGTLEWAGDYEVAANAWTIVANTSTEHYLQVLALDAISHICALTGDEAGFIEHAARCDAIGHESLHSAHAQILYYRGLSYRALGQLEQASSWLERAMAFTEEHSFNEEYFKAEEALGTLDSHTVELVDTTPAAPTTVREGVEAMRRELVGV